ncbi:MAG: glycosyltransferase family 39 protein, partial [Saprospiraceae bacterium]|nr:glycosyltransferase family 39 protein [Saprospiraceae bacterium]
MEGLTKQQPWILLLLGALFFIPFLGGVHLFDWDEINFATIAQEMVLTGDYLQVKVGGHPFWEKPPLFFWLQAISFTVFGINEFAARLPNAITGIVTLLLLYYLGKRLQDARFGWWWALVYLGSILPHLYFRSGIIDPLFNLFMFLGLAFLFLAPRSDKSNLFGILSGIVVGLAVLTKGPVAVLLIGLTWLIAQIFFERSKRTQWSTLLLAIGSGLLTLGLWFGAEIMAHGSWFVEEFLRYQVRLLSTEDAGHGGFPGYHIVVLLFGCFPASWLLFKGWRKGIGHNDTTGDFQNWMKILLAVVVIIFSVVQSKIVHYSSLAYFPITFLAAYWITSVKKDKSFSGLAKWGLISTWIILLFVCI